MSFLNKVLSFALSNRRAIGSIVGGSLIMFGFVDEGNFIIKAGEQ